MYTKKEILDVPVLSNNNKYYFVVNKHIASMLSSYYEENKKDYRGFAIITNIGEIEKVYVFVIHCVLVRVRCKCYYELMNKESVTD